MANEMQRGNLTGTATMRMPISGTVSIGGKQMKELRFMPYSEFPEEGREDVLYIDTDGNAMYYWDGTEYIALSGGGSGGTSNYNELSNKPSINDITLTGNKTSADLGLQPTISDLATIRSGAASGATAVQPSDMETALASKQDVIDDLSDIRTGAAAGETAVQPSALENALSGKQDVISDLADIRSGAAAGATALQPEDIDTLPTDGSSNPVSSGGVHTALSGKQDTIADLSDIRSGAAAGATAVQPSALNDYQTKLSGTNKLDPAYIDYDASHRAVSDTEKSTWNGKQDTILDLSTIRSGAAAGATALQQSDVTSTYSASGTAPVNGTAVSDALGTLDVSSVGGSGKYISEISETDGKISATVETMDTTPTSGSEKAVTSGAVYTALASKQNELSQSQLAAANSGITAEKLATDEAALAEVVDSGAKNKLHYNGISTTSGDTTNISFSCSGDLITITGSTSSNAAWCYLTLDGSIIVVNDFCNGKYYLSSERTGSGPVDIFVYESSVGQIADESGNGVVIPNKTTTNAVRIMINIPKGATVNITLKIMICTAADWAVSQKFVPYAPSNRELYEMIQALQNNS